jgi:outer membrane protein assembly factor BamD
MKLILISLVTIILISCSSDEQKGRTEAESLYKEAQELIKSERYILANEKLNQIKTQHPYSYYATPSELLQAEVLFKQENYIEAAAAFILFRDFHPKHAKIDYVIFMIAEAYYEQIPSTIDRDLESAIEAIKYYEEVISKYPESKHVNESKRTITKCKKMLREKERYIADFYFKTKVYQGARYWYEELFTNSSKKEDKQHSMFRIIASSELMKDYKGCINFGEKFNPEIDKQYKEELESILKRCLQKLNKK